MSLARALPVGGPAKLQEGVVSLVKSASAPETIPQAGAQFEFVPACRRLPGKRVRC